MSWIIKQKAPGASWFGVMAIAMALSISPGCKEATTEPLRPETVQPVDQATYFDPDTAGAVRGKVIWTGDIPEAPPWEIRSLVTAANPARPRLIRENPHALTIDPVSKGVAGAVVSLRGIDKDRARPWDHPPVVVEHAQRSLYITQGETGSRFGFVKQGSAITMVSREKEFNSLHASGAAFFTLTFPDPDRPLKRVLNDAGLIEFSSAAGYYWMRAYVFVADHPYFTLTNARGEFEMSGVPPGQYQAVCWLPNWNVRSMDRHPESSLIQRAYFHSPAETIRDFELGSGGAAAVEFKAHLDLFPR